MLLTRIRRIATRSVRAGTGVQWLTSRRNVEETDLDDTVTSGSKCGGRKNSGTQCVERFNFFSSAAILNLSISCTRSIMIFLQIVIDHFGLHLSRLTKNASPLVEKRAEICCLLNLKICSFKR